MAERLSDEVRAFIEGMSVSVDVSTGDHDADHRYFGTVTEVMDDLTDKHGVTLLVQNAEPNFTPPKPVGYLTERGQFYASLTAMPKHEHATARPLVFASGVGGHVRFFRIEPAHTHLGTIYRVKDERGQWVADFADREQAERFSRTDGVTVVDGQVKR